MVLQHEDLHHLLLPPCFWPEITAFYCHILIKLLRSPSCWLNLLFSQIELLGIAKKIHFILNLLLLKLFLINISSYLLNLSNDCKVCCILVLMYFALVQPVSSNGFKLFETHHCQNMNCFRLATLGLVLTLLNKVRRDSYCSSSNLLYHGDML